MLSAEDLKNLPPTQPVLVLPVVDGLTPKEYARTTGIPFNTVKKMLSDSRLPRIKKELPDSKVGSKAAVLVNVQKLAIDAITREY